MSHEPLLHLHATSLSSRSGSAPAPTSLAIERECAALCNKRNSHIALMGTSTRVRAPGVYVSGQLPTQRRRPVGEQKKERERERERGTKIDFMITGDAV